MLSNSTGPRAIIRAVHRRLLAAVGLGVAVTAGGAWAMSLDYLADDAFISFRYARNLAAGHGLVYNPGERVEGYTNFLEVVSLAALRRLGVDLVAAGRGLSLVSGAAGVVLAWALARRGLRRLSPLALVAAALVAVNPYHAAWAGAGLEATLFSALLAAAALPLVGASPTRGSFVVVSALALLLALTRPEGALLYGVLLAGGWATARGDRRARLRTIAPGLALFVLVGGAYFVARWLYFGDLLPNTFHAKSAFTVNHVWRGLAYLRGFARNAFALCASPLVAAGAWAAARRRLWPLMAVPLCVLAVVVAEGGDGLPMYRFVVPALPFLAALAALGAEVAQERLGRAGLVLGLTVAGLVCLLSFFPNRDEQLLNYLYQRNYEVPAWSAAGRALRRSFPPGTTLAAVPIGALGYYSDLPIIDMVGLTDRTIARARVADMGAGWAGHEKHDGAYVLSRRPDILLLGNVYVDSRPAVPPGQFPPHTVPSILAREEDVVTQPAFARDYELRDLPVAPGLWLHYFARKDLAAAR
jgi:arabinofuranosyltransferase